MAEIVVRGGTLVTEGLPQSDISIENGRIQAIGPDLPGAAEEIDARGLHVFPGIIDVHLHFNEPGRTEWEGSATGQSRIRCRWWNPVLRHAAEFDSLHHQRSRVRP